MATLTDKMVSKWHLQARPLLEQEQDSLIFYLKIQIQVCFQSLMALVILIHAKP